MPAVFSSAQLELLEEVREDYRRAEDGDRPKILGGVTKRLIKLEGKRIHDLSDHEQDTVAKVNNPVSSLAPI
jgi:hypothetical protein